MTKRWQKVLASGAVLLLALSALSACGKKEAETTKESEVSNEIAGEIKLWLDTDQIKVYTPLVEQFEKENPKVKVTIKAGESANAKADVSKDPSSAADVFMFPHDQIGQLAEAGLLYENTKYAEEVTKNNVASAIEGATYDGKLYGYPYGVESQFLYYNKAKLTEEDIKSWDTLTAKGKIGVNLAEAGANYAFAPLFMSNGDLLYGASGEELTGTDFNNDKGIEVLKWIAAQKDNPGVIQSNAATLSNLEAGKIDAFLSGPWSKNDAKKALGDNFAVAPYPTVNFGNGDVQMKAFLGVKLFGVNAQTKSPLAAMALAHALTTKDAQITVFEGSGIVPANAEAQEDEKVTADAVALAVKTMSAQDHSVVMPKLPEMSNFWPPMDAIFNDTYKGKITEDQMQEKLDKFVSDISKESK